MTWDPAGPGVLALPSGRLLRGRALRKPVPPGLSAQFAVLLAGPSTTIRWPDFWLPLDRVHAAAVLRSAWERAASERVEVACFGGRGRTGTALACIAVLDGVPAAEAVAYVRARYDRHAVETPWQRRYVQTFKPVETT